MSVLDSTIHARLIEDIDHVSELAGIPKRFIHESMAQYCPEEQVKWVSQFRQQQGSGYYGLCISGMASPAQQMMSITGAFVRNFVDARLISLQSLLEALKNGDPPNATVLLVPSFHRTGLTSYQINALWSFLEDRMLADLQTVVQVQSIAQIGSEYGKHFRAHLENHFHMSIVE